MPAVKPLRFYSLKTGLVRWRRRVTAGTMAAARLLVSCRSCRRAVALVPDINNAALVVLATRLRCLHRGAAPGEQSTPTALLRRFRFAAAEPRRIDQVPRSAARSG